ncbi:hypothetical protein M434DRAFT_345316 [Hypoxylon sp. CO27-5]|nr:hypothetical protein M434DRAFT_345316 [Hypoxylon sp. CO27-5]
MRMLKVVVLALSYSRVLHSNIYQCSTHLRHVSSDVLLCLSTPGIWFGLHSNTKKFELFNLDAFCCDDCAWIFVGIRIPYPVTASMDGYYPGR